MQSIEAEGSTIDDAIARALQLLGAPRERVEIEILSDASRGMFGFGGKKARVRATVRAPLALDEARAVSRETSPGVRRRVAEAEDSAPPARPAPRERRSAPESPAPMPSPPSESFRARSQELLTTILSHVGVSCTVEVRPGAEEGALHLEVKGDSSGLLIGRRGQTLDAIEYMVNRLARGNDEDGRGRVVVDVESYRERRREYLQTLARRLADKAKQTGRVVTLNPMSPRDRRIVHLALQGDPTITTRSQGEGYLRNVLITVADSRKARPGSPRG